MKLFNRDELPLNKGLEDAMSYQALSPEKLEQQDMERVFARLFSSDDGRKVLAYLQMMTFHRALAPTSSDMELRYVEGQRAMVATILRLIDRGRKG